MTLGPRKNKKVKQYLEGSRDYVRRDWD